MKTKILTLVVAAGFLGGCNTSNLSDGQTGASSAPRPAPASASRPAAASARWSAPA